MNENKNKYEIDAKQILDMLIKRWWIIVVAVVILAGAALGYTKLTAVPTYTSSATLLINGSGKNMSSYQQILMGQYQSKDYPYILKSLDTLSNAAVLLNEKEGDAGKSYDEYKLSGMVSCKAEEDARIFKISVTSTDPQEAQRVAMAVSDAFITAAEQKTAATVEEVELPRLPTNASTSSAKRSVVVGAAVGFVIGAVIALILGLNADTLDSNEWLLQKYKEKAPLLASVPNSSTSGGKNYYRYKYKKYYSYSYNNAKNNKNDN